MEPPGSCWWAFLSLSVRSKCDPLYVMMTPISIISEFERHLSYIGLMHFVSIQTFPPMRVALKNISFFPEQKSFLDLEWKPKSSVLFFSHFWCLLAIPWAFYGQNPSNDCSTSTFLFSRKNSFFGLWWELGRIFCSILQPVAASLARDAPHVPLVWLILCCPVGHVGGRRDDDVVSALENVDVDICKTKF